jgi:restriction system protein
MAQTQEPQVDISYHYPPELLELLCDAVPVLARSKEGVIDFFAGAGVPARHLVDWKQKVRQDKANVRKHEMARSILRRLNEAGESALAPRREVLKRVAQFEDFSACWENDRYKAQGLVSQIQKVINVKDSFTRINLERERERKERQATYMSSLEAKQKQAERRTALKNALYKLFAERDPHKRGKQLEEALNSLFEFAEILIREAFTLKSQKGEGIIEQIDGVVEIDGALYIVEMKWWDKPIGRSELAPHLVSVYGRGDVAGICISYSGFTPAAIDEAKIGLAQKVFVLTELHEIVQTLEGEGDLKALFREKIRRAKADRNPFHKVSP